VRQCSASRCPGATPMWVRPMSLAMLLFVSAPIARAWTAPRLARPVHPRRLAALRASEVAGDVTSSTNLIAENEQLRQKVMELEATIERTEGLCEVLDTGDWASSLSSRARWLLGLLVAQSCSSFILADNEGLLTSHPTVVFFMTMLVGAGGNAGNQASVRLIRGLATGEVNPASAEQTRRLVFNEARVALSLALILVLAGYARVTLFSGSPADATAISASLFLIVSTSVILGTVLPLVLNRLRIDAAHASTSIQVIMDVVGVLITCTVAPLVFEMAAG